VSAERVANNQALHREVNQRIAEVGDSLFSEAERNTERDFLCECGNAACMEHLWLTIGTYRAVRANPRRFVIVPGHDNPAVELVVEDRGSYSIVETFGEAGEIAEALAENWRPSSGSLAREA
jgi:hypothetical protein